MMLLDGELCEGLLLGAVEVLGNRIMNSFSNGQALTVWTRKVSGLVMRPLKRIEFLDNILLLEGALGQWLVLGRRWERREIVDERKQVVAGGRLIFHNKKLKRQDGRH